MEELWNSGPAMIRAHFCEILLPYVCSACLRILPFRILPFIPLCIPICLDLDGCHQSWSKVDLESLE